MSPEQTVFPWGRRRPVRAVARGVARCDETALGPVLGSATQLQPLLHARPGTLGVALEEGVAPETHEHPADETCVAQRARQLQARLIERERSVRIALSLPSNAQSV